MTRDELIEQLLDALAEAIKQEGVSDFKGRDSVVLLKALYRSQAEDTRQAYEREKFEFIEANKHLLDMENKSPNWMTGTQGVGRRLNQLEHIKAEPIDAATG